MDSRLPTGVTKYYASLAEREDPARDPIAAQFIPRPEETLVLPYETADPLADNRYRVTARLIHHYRDRALLLVNDRCATYCRHCFRRHFTGHGTGRITEDELAAAVSYLRSHPAVQEILLSGGDPLMLRDAHLGHIISALRAVRQDYIIRIATRVPVVQPRRITDGLVDRLSGGGATWIVTQVNHPREMTALFDQAIGRFVDRGLPVLNQAVLLRGVNDAADTLEALFRGLLRRRVKPYYLFQGDLAGGTAHFRTTIDEGLELMRILRTRLSGMAIPTYAVDLPGGGGKIELTEGSVLRREGEWYVLCGLDGGEYRYPREDRLNPGTVGAAPDSGSRSSGLLRGGAPSPREPRDSPELH
ncbi:MAG: KamA family radical SAM protein [bacterium]